MKKIIETFQKKLLNFVIPTHILNSFYFIIPLYLINEAQLSSMNPLTKESSL
jgi:hypothetical protein